jgi:branched-chain amino acid transport system substrate-binding protein
MKRLLFLFLMFLASCVHAQDKVVIGAILPLSGPIAFYGADEQTAIDLALEDVGGKVQVVYEDSAGDNSKAVAAFQKLSNVDNAKIVITATSWISNTVYSPAIDAGLLQAIIASAAFKRTREDRAVRLTQDVTDEVPYLLEYLEPFNRVAVAYLDNDYGKAWVDELRKALGDKLVAAESHAVGEVDVSAQITKIKAADPDILILVTSGRLGGLHARKAREQGITAQLAGTRPIENPELLQEKAAVEGLVYTYPDYDVDHPFIARYVAKYGKHPTVFSVEAYDTIVLLAQAVDACGSDTACMHGWFRNKEFDGALGHITFDDTGDAHYPAILKQVRNGTFGPFK